MSTSTIKNVKWREILTPQYAPKLAILAMSVWLHAANSNLTATTMPSAVAEVGGLHLISWAFALYLAGSICGGASISLVITRYGIRSTMCYAALLYAIGCVVAASAPSMQIILVGRTLQGLGGGALLALVYVAQDRFFPNRFVPKIVGCISMIWMISSFTGPTLGGAFATYASWRFAFWTFAFLAVLLIPAIRALLHASDTIASTTTAKFPFVRLCYLCASILMISMAGANFDPIASPLLVVGGICCFIFFLYRDQKASTSRMLPKEVLDFTHNIGNGVATTFLLSLCIMSFLVYGPLILIRLYGMNPLEAGFIIIIETIAWGSVAILFSGTPARFEPYLIRTGSALVVISLTMLAYVLPKATLWPVIVALILGNGGFGMMWGFIIRRIIDASAEGERDRTSSSVPITQQAGFAIGAALSGLIANSMGVSDGASIGLIEEIAFWLFAGFVPIAIIGNIFAWRFVRS